MKQKDPIPADERWQAKSLRDFPGSPSERIGAGWMLITAAPGKTAGDGWNTMTASWGGFGVLWGRDTAFWFIRPSRHTYGFANRADLFTLSFFDESRRKALTFCGEKSGRDYDKAAETGLTPIVFGPSLKGARDLSAEGAVSFLEAREIVVCRKLYTHDFDPAGFLDRESIEKSYHGKDYHRMFIGEVVTLLTRS
jgi:flavin reductase (DIM6/NTAB) family NADH-FMN oxidoreductase RutF